MEQTPPLEPGPIPVRPTVWPTVLGMICAAYASLMLACNCSGFFTLRIYRWMEEFERGSGQPARTFQIEYRVVEQHLALIMTVCSLAMIASAGLLIAAITLIRRRERSRRWLMGWAVVELSLLLMSVVLQALMTLATMSAMRQEGLHQEASDALLEGIVTGGTTLLLSTPLPVFLLIWFRRVAIKAEVVSWRAL